MATKDQFTDEEWDAVVAGIYAAGFLIMTAHPSAAGILKQSYVLARTVKDTSDARYETELVEELQSWTKEHHNTLPFSEIEGDLYDPANLEREFGFVGDALAVVDEKATPQDAAAYRQWLAHIARATAESVKHGGALGIGGERISDKEQAALDRLDEILAVPGT